MNNVYLLLKFLHVTAAAVWVGGLVVSSVLNARIARESDAGTMAALARQGGEVGRMVLGPAAGLTLITGGAAMAVANIGFSTWIIWGLVAMIVSMALGGSIVRRTNEALVARAADASSRHPELVGLVRKLSLAHAALVLILLSTVWAMVFKPAF